MNGVWMATVLVALGLLPGFYQWLLEALSSVAGSLAFHFPLSRIYSSEPRPISHPIWLAFAGMAILFLTIVLNII